MKAIDKFNLSKECRFATYDSFWIRQSIIRAIANKSRIVRIPVDAFEKTYKLKKVTKKLTEQLKREPTIKEIAQEFGTTEKK